MFSRFFGVFLGVSTCFFAFSHMFFEFSNDYLRKCLQNFYYLIAFHHSEHKTDAIHIRLETTTSRRDGGSNNTEKSRQDSKCFHPLL